LLSNRELQVFERIGRGLNTKEISDELKVSVKTVETHREGIKSKLPLGGHHPIGPLRRVVEPGNTALGKVTSRRHSQQFRKNLKTG
jgi:hypothetical protein